MVAVPQARAPLGPSVAAGGPASPRPTSGPEPGAGHRAVAVVVDVMELLRPQSDLARMLARFDAVDVLVASEGADAGLADDLDGDDFDDDRDDGDLDDDRDDDDRDDDGTGELAARMAALELPNLSWCRLGLRVPFGPPAEQDLVAAMSELVGFDPEPGVYCLAPVGGDASRAAVARAAQRIAQVYGLPLLRYRSLELSVVGAGSPA